jgi:hypothetical protein
MSEPSQLYARVRISRNRLDEFLRSAFPDPSGDEAVLAWLSKAEYYGERYTPELIRERTGSFSTVGAWIDWLMEPAASLPMPSRNSYDAATQTWALAALDFSENYDDYIAAVATFREAAKYKDLPGNDGFLVYGFLFESGHVAVALGIETGESRFLEESEAESLVSEADAAMEELIAEGAAGSEES